MRIVYLLACASALSLVSCQNGGSVQNPLAGLFNRQSSPVADNGGYSAGNWNQGTSTGYAQSGYGTGQSATQGVAGWQNAVGNPANPATYVSGGQSQSYASGYGASQDTADVQPYTDNGSYSSGYDAAYTAPQSPVKKAPSTTTYRPTTPTKVAKITSPSTRPQTSVTSYRPSTSASGHSVQKGDTLYSISRRYGMSVAELQSINGLSDSNIRIGQTLSVR